MAYVDGGAKTQMQLFIRHVVKLVVVAHIVKSARLLEQKGGICIFRFMGLISRSRPDSSLPCRAN